MPCGCSSKTQYRATRPDGSTMDYRTRDEAEADVRRNGGTFSALS